MDFNDQFLYKLIKQLQTQMIYVLSIIGKAQQNNITLLNLIQQGTADPNTGGISPLNGDVGGFYSQTDGSGNPLTLWIWLPGATSWK